MIIVPDPRAEERKRRRDDAEGPADDAVDGGVVPPSGAVAGARHRPSATKLDSARFEIAKSEIVKTVVTRKQHGRSKRVPWTAVETQELERLHLYYEAQGVKSTQALPGGLRETRAPIHCPFPRSSVGKDPARRVGHIQDAFTHEHRLEGPLANCAANARGSRCGRSEQDACMGKG